MLDQRVLYIDFRDSFSFSLLGLVKKFFRNVHRIDYLRINDVEVGRFDLVVLGPGPGHIDDYLNAKEFLNKNIGTVKFLGVCLGHQLLCDFVGFECERLAFPLHGVSFDITNISKFLDIEQISAQFYNSWVMTGRGEKSLEHTAIYEKGFVGALFAKDIAGIQFHPESVGTNCPELVFEKILHTMYNRSHDLKNGRSLRLTNY